MILFFDPNPPFLRWCKAENGVFSERRSMFSPGWADTVLRDIGSADGIQAIGYMLNNGGGEITAPVSLLSRDLLAKVERCIGLLPEHNGATSRIANYWTDALPAIPHILFCDTAFFIDLPSEVSTYAVPHELLKKGIRRYGGDGLAHRWAWKKTQALLNNQSQKLLSVHLGDYTNIAAICNGKPLETTCGFSSLEGIPSSTGCGDIDPTIVFQLHSSGMSLGEINGLLSRESGFTGLSGEECAFLDLAQGSDPKRDAVREIFLYTVVKYAGAFISVLGGIDSIVFLGSQMRESLNIISEICCRLEFLGVKCAAGPQENGKLWHLSARDSRVAVFGMQCTAWEIMREEADTVLKKEV